MGISASLVPSAIPMVSTKLSLQTADLLPAVPALFGGLFTAVALAPRTIARFGPSTVMRVASLVVGAALALNFLVPTAWVFIASAAAVGLGFGFLEVAATSATRHRQQDTSRLLTKLNIAFALSAMSAPLLLALEADVFSSRFTFIVGAVFALAVATTVGSSPSRNQGRVAEPIFFRGAFVAFALAAAFYVGAESILAGWAATIVFELSSLNPATAAIGSSAFWGLLALGRLLWLVVGAHAVPSSVAMIIWPTFAALSMILSWIAIDSSNSVIALVGFGLATLAAGPIYSLIIGSALDAHQAGSAVALTSFLIFAGAGGGFLLPALLQLSPEISSATLMAGGGFAATSIFAALASARVRKATESREPTWA